MKLDGLGSVTSSFFGQRHAFPVNKVPLDNATNLQARGNGPRDSAPSPNCPIFACLLTIDLDTLPG